MSLARLILLHLILVHADAYSISTTPLNFTDAVTYCQNIHNSTLASIYTPQQNAIASKLCLSVTTNNCWIGLNNIQNNWKWIDNNISVGYTSWRNKPTNNEHLCTELIANNSNWNATSCSNLKLPICNTEFDGIRSESVYRIFSLGGINPITTNQTNIQNIYLNCNNDASIVNLSDIYNTKKWIIKHKPKDIHTIQLYPQNLYLSVTNNATSLQLVNNDTLSGFEEWIFEAIDDYYHIYPNINHSIHNKQLLSVETNGYNVYLSAIDDKSGRQRWSVEFVSNISEVSESTHYIMDTYYLIPSKLGWNDAELYCQSHCNSDLASIHNQKDYLDMINMIYNYQTNYGDNSIWFGLNNIANEYSYSYDDTTYYDYGNDYTQYPWVNDIKQEKYRSSNQCGYMRFNNQKWDIDNCSIPKPFVCNDCQWNIITKYIMINEEKQWIDGQRFCEDTFNTSLASVLNGYNLNETDLLLNLYNIDAVWIGNNDSVNCDTLSKQNGISIDNCSIPKRFICNIPSELCYKTQWNELSGDWIWSDNTCDLYGNNGGNIDEIQFNLFSVYKWKQIVIEYAFSVNNPINIQSRAGIVLNIKDGNYTYALSIFVFYRKNIETARLVTNYGGSSYNSEILSGFQFNKMYALRIEIDSNGEFEISMHNVTIKSNTNKIFVTSIDSWFDSLTIHNDGISSHSQSLYINGELTPHIHTNAPIIAPTNSPTIIPTTSPIATNSNISSNVSASTDIPITSTIAYTTSFFPSVSPTTDLPTTHSPTITKPNIIVSAPNEIGKCDDLVLDARGTTNLEGTDAIFQWNIVDINYTEYGDLVTIPNEILSTLTENILIELTVIGSLDGTASFKFIVFKSSSEVVPNIILNGVNEITSKNTKLLNNKIDIYSSISFENNCNNNDVLIESKNYNIYWYVDVKTEDNNKANIDTTSLNAFLLTQKSDAITIDIMYLQSGFAYTFIMQFICIDLDFDCDLTTTHTISYKASDINVHIMGGDVNLQNISVSDLQSYTMDLNGKLLTFDPDNLESNNLGFKWQCMDHKNNSCDYLLGSINSSITVVDLGKFSANLTSENQNQRFQFTFILAVFDMYNANRGFFYDAITLAFTVADTKISLIAITATAIQNQISIDDKMRIITDINVVKTETIYKWSELHGLLSESEIIEHSESSENSFNLILKPNVLQAGETYLFQLEVSKYDESDQLIAFGASSTIEINILSIPQIIEGSFAVELGTNMFQDINHYLYNSSGYTVSILAEGDDEPYLFQFMYNYNYLHGTLLSISYLDNVLLPIGNNEIIVNVYNTQLSKVTDVITYLLTLDSYSVCPDVSYLSVDSQSVSQHDNNLHQLQRIMVYLQYLYDYYDDIDNIDQCLGVNLYSILELLSKQFTNLCHSDSIILLAQIIDLWLDLVNSNDNLIAQIYSDDDISLILHNLIMMVLDPCGFIADDIDYSNVEKLYTSKNAIITNVIEIYYNNTDVTTYLSPIITNNQYQNALLGLTQTLIQSVNHFRSSNTSLINNIGLDIDNMMRAILHISTLSEIAKFIPGESVSINTDEFSVFAIRTANKQDDPDMNVAVNNISVNIPNDILLLENSETIFDSIDTMIVGFNGNEQTLKDENYVISNQSISITIIGEDVNTANLISNIDITFDCYSDVNNGCNDNICVWYDQKNNMWKNDGCTTIIEENGNIVCTCSHLTTFAMIKSIKSEEIIVDEVFASDLWDVMNWLFGSLFFVMSIYIILQIYPFFIDKYLSYKQNSVIIMLLLFVVSIIYFVVCMQFHFLKYANVNSNNIHGHVIILLLLLLRWVYFMVYSMIFNTWFILAHSMSKTQETDHRKMKIILIRTNIF
eukprot:99823_1